jgi:hypothetical protein
VETDSSDWVDPVLTTKTRKVLGKPKGRTGRTEAIAVLVVRKIISEVGINHVGGRSELGNENSINSTEAYSS